MTMAMAGVAQSAIARGGASEAEKTFRAEELDGLRLATRGRMVSLAAVAVLLFFLAPPPEIFYYHGALVLFALNGLADYAVASRPFGRPWHRYVFIALDFTMMTYLFIAPNPLEVLQAPAQMQLRNGTFVYFFMLLAGFAFSFNPRLMVWAGFAAAVSWIVGTATIVLRPDTITWFDATVSEILSDPDRSLAEYLDPRFVDINVIVQDVVVVLIVAGLLAGVVARSRSLVLRQAAAARERANLARYFSPNMVDELAKSDRPLDQVRSQPVAVLFADIVGFTTLSETMAPEAVIGLLRECHGRLGRIVFRHNGTIDKYIGDAIMATFGTPRVGPADAGDALACARAMTAEIAQWNRDRAQAGEPAIVIGIGLHYGEAVLGDIGGEGRLEFTVIGDTVNVASRLEALTRTLSATIVASHPLVRQAKSDRGEALLEGFVAGEPQSLRNRTKPMEIWVLPAEG